MSKPFELIGPEPALGLDNEASQWLSDQGVISRSHKNFSRPLTTQVVTKCDASVVMKVISPVKSEEKSHRKIAADFILIVQLYII